MRALLSTICLFSFFHLSAQVIYLSTTDDRIMRLDIESCQYEEVIHLNRAMTDITFHPDGTFFGINNTGVLFIIDTLTGNTTDIHDFNGQTFNSLTTSAEGIIYTTGDDGELWSYDVNTGLANFLGSFGHRATGDLTFYKGELYVAIQNDRIVRINLANPPFSSIILDENIPGEVFGIVSYTAGCDTINCYAISSGTSEIYLINFAESTLNLVCELDIQVGGGASTYEFLGSQVFEMDTVTIIDPTCNGNDGQITVSVTPGFGIVEYSLNDGAPQTSPVFPNLPGGNYTITATTQNGCVAEEEVNLSSLNGPVIDDVSISHIDCNNLTGSLTIIATSVNSLMYSIDDIQFQASPFFANLSAGTYAVIAMDANGCRAMDVIEITYTPGPVIDSIHVTGGLCDDNNGSVEVFVTSDFPLRYSIDGTIFQSETLFNNLQPGVYNVIVEDINGCRDSDQAEVMQGTTITIEEITTLPTKCGLNNGSATVEISGGTPPVHYSLAGQAQQPGGYFPGLGGGTYTVLVTDDMGCTNTGTFIIAPSVNLSIETIEITDAECGSASGTVKLSFNPPDNVTSSIPGIGNVTNGIFSNLPSGTYAIHNVNENGCVADTSVTVDQLKCGIYIPNTFSPNGDGFNDQFIITAAGDAEIMVTKFLIFDRWGNNVFEAYNFPIHETSKFWDGTFRRIAVNPAVFAYFIEITENNVTTTFKGNVTLVR